MRFRSANNNNRALLLQRSLLHRESGAIMPWFVLSFSVLFAFLAFTADVMRTIHAVSVLQFGSQAAALAAYWNVFGGDGTQKPGSIEDNVFQSLQATGGGTAQAWNQAPAGPQNNVSQTPISFQNSDLQVIRNPNGNDAGDFFLQVTATRNDANSLTTFFLPAIYAANSLVGQPIPAQSNVANPYRTTEIITQPATRIGPGAPAGSNSRFVGYATFPIAISNILFATAATKAQTNYTLDITSGTFQGLTADLKGAFVNLTANGGVNGYYGPTTGATAFNELLGTINYYLTGNVQTSTAPAAVERGSQLTAFNVNAKAFQQATIITALNSLIAANPTRYYIFPVVSANPNPGQTINVVGFARARLVSAVATAGNISLNISLGASEPMTNASIGTSITEIPTLSGAAVPTPGVPPFNSRPYDVATNTIGPRPLGVVMAPALSPRQITGGLF